MKSSFEFPYVPMYMKQVNQLTLEMEFKIISRVLSSLSCVSSWRVHQNNRKESYKNFWFVIWYQKQSLIPSNI